MQRQFARNIPLRCRKLCAAFVTSGHAEPIVRKTWGRWIWVLWVLAQLWLGNKWQPLELLPGDHCDQVVASLHSRHFFGLVWALDTNPFTANLLIFWLLQSSIFSCFHWPAQSFVCYCCQFIKSHGMELTTNRLINQKYLSKLWPARLVRQRTEQACLQTGTSFCMHSFCHSSGYFMQVNQSKTFNGPGDFF